MGGKQSVLSYMWAYIKRYKYFEIAALLLNLISAAAGIGNGWISKLFIDNVFLARALNLLLPVSLFGIAIICINVVSMFFMEYLFARVGHNIVADIRTQLFDHVIKLPYRFYANVQVGEIISRLMNDTSSLQSVIASALVNIANSVITITAVLVWVFIIDWRLALLILPVPPLFALIIKVFGNKVSQISMAVQQYTASITALLEQIISGVELIKIFLMEKITDHLLKGRIKELAQATVKRSVQLNVMSSAWSIIVLPYQAVFFGIGGYWYITQGKPTIGTLFAFLNYISMLIGPTVTLMNLRGQFSQASASIKRIFEYLDHEPEREGQRELHGSVQGHVRYEGVCFSYDGQKDVLKDINLVVEAGHMVALVGPTGSGKTTLTRLLMRLYAPDRGRITMDGIDIADLTLKSLRKSIGWVPQETYLFDASIRENLLYARPDATEQEIEEACKKAQIHDFITALPDGYDTVIGERGIKLSGGERQRLSIARAILKDPKILVMDEPTSELDALTEAALWEAINKHFKGRTVLVVAHRLSTVRSADKIVVMEKGCIVEEGKHEELLERNGLYAELYHKQFEKDEQIAVM